MHSNKPTSTKAEYSRPVRISIVINNYNYGRFLNDCINSALNQTYAHTEVIVVDDGSTDNSRAILASRGADVKTILKENGGQASAFNAGFSGTTGDVVLFLDADDMLLPEAVQTIATLWTPEHSKVQFLLEIVDGSGKRQNLTTPRGKLSRGDVRQEILSAGSYRTPPTSGNAYARWLLSAVMPIPCDEWRKGADAFLNTQAGMNGKIASWDAPLGLYRIHGSSLSTVVQDNSVRLDQIEYLIGLHVKLQRLVEETATQHNLKPEPNLLMRNLSHLKLLVTRSRMAGPYTTARFVETARLARTTIRCALAAEKDSVSSRIQVIFWAAAITFAPKKSALRLIKIAFTASPKSRFLAALRRA